MPRIRAASVAEHVAQMEDAVLSAADRLFTERGIAEVSLGDVAAAVGLARSSLYRYVGDKDALVLAWFAHRLPGERERVAAALTGPGTPADRVRRWAGAQLDFSVDPAHGVTARLLTDAGQLRPATRAALAASHAELLDPVRATVAEALGRRRAGEVDTVLALIGGLVGAASRHVILHGDSRALRRRLDAALAALLA